MLPEIDSIKDKRDVGEHELRWVASQSRPITFETGVDDELQEREHAAPEVELDLEDRPADGGLALVVHPCLWEVFRDSDDELDIAKGVDLDGISRGRTSNLFTRMQLTTSIQAQPLGSYPPSFPLTSTMATTTKMPVIQPAQIPITGQLALCCLETLNPQIFGQN